MSIQPLTPPDTSSDATLAMLEELIANKRINGEASAVRDAHAFACACFAFIQANAGHPALQALLLTALADSRRRAANDRHAARSRS